MRLKSLELKGFKSFAEKTIVHFNDNVIGVVGSNGCGKSNIVDAIRWVLGEQKTKHLRSDSMTNVIFNGTKDRNAAGLAEVTLIFENNKGILPTEFQEVSIKRILYKDGTGEYFLNGIRCRLKDINNLLSDTGIGPDSYAIIALNMVDELLADKDNSRLKLFEQAAGVTKYKIRKKESLSKLHQTEEDLSRVDDLLFEIDQQVKSLEKQAKRAKRYQEIKLEYKATALDLYQSKIHRFKNDYLQIEKQIETEKSKMSSLEQIIQQLEKEISQVKNNHLLTEETLQASQKDLSQIHAKIRNKENEQKLHSQKNLFIEQNNQKIETKIVENIEKLNQLEYKQLKIQDQISSEKRVLEIHDQELDWALQHLTEIKNKYNLLKLDIDQIVLEQKSYNHKIFETEKLQAVLSSQLEQLRKQQIQLKENVNLLKNKEEENQLLKSVLEADQTQLEAEKNHLEIAEKERLIQWNEIEKLKSELQETREKISREKHIKTKEFELLQSMFESMEGFEESIKFLNKHHWNQNNQFPLLSDIIHCKPEHRIALENFLDPYVGYYIVEKQQDALAGIQLLRENKKGKSGFFVLSEIPSVASSQNMIPIEGAIPVIDLIETEEKYKKLIYSLFHHVYICTEIEISSEISEHAVLLNSQGDIKKGNSFFGGFSGSVDSNKIGRKKSIEILSKEILELTKQESENELKLNEMILKRNRLIENDKSKYIKELDQTIFQKDQELKYLIKKLEEASLTSVQNEEHLQKFEKQIKEIKNQLLELEGDLDNYQRLLERVQFKFSELETYFQNASEELTKQNAIYNQKHIEQVRQSNQVSSLEKENIFLENVKLETQKAIQNDRNAMQSADLEMNQIKLEMNSSERELSDLYEKKKVLQQKVSEHEKMYFEARAIIHDKEENWKNQQKLNNQQIQLLFQLEQKFNEIKLQIQGIAERVKMEFEMNVNDLLQSASPDKDWSEDAEKNVEKLRRILNEFGPVNEMAVEAYDEARERLNFIQLQKNDLLASKDTILETLHEIDNTANQKFMAAFGTVRTNFIKVFRSLFEEDDTCDLILSDPKQPLESKIEIIAKPKGKRPLTINQLSGGEKTLTATALLFALYLLKPAPFCIFDEVDAPLDDSNISKFNHIIKDFSEQSQFIIVTHNKKTMSSVEIMYGVTMVKGISKLVPVDFRALENVLQ